MSGHTPRVVERTPTTLTIEVDMRRMLTDPDYFKADNERWEQTIQERMQDRRVALESAVFDTITGTN